MKSRQPLQPDFSEQHECADDQQIRRIDLPAPEQTEQVNGQTEYASGQAETAGETDSGIGVAAGTDPMTETIDKAETEPVTVTESDVENDVETGTESDAGAVSETEPEPDSPFAAAMQRARQRLPLPLERQSRVNPVRVLDLLRKLDQAQNAETVIHLAHVMTSKELSFIFPALATELSKTQQDRLFLLIRERACPSLYLQGWLAYQQHYPNPMISKALIILCGILEIKQLDLADQHQDLTVRNLLKPDDKNLSHTEIQGQIPLISLLTPLNSRNFIRKLNLAITAQHLTMDQFMKKYHVRPELPFGATLLSQAFLTGDARFYHGNQKSFENIFLTVPADTQVELMHQLLSLSELSVQERHRYYQLIYRIIGLPEQNHPVWTKMNDKDRQAFGNWLMQATIGTHCRYNPQKARLYLRYSAVIEQIGFWDDSTLLLRFPGFIIADHQQQPDEAMFYSHDELDLLTAHIRADRLDTNPTDESIPHKIVEDALRFNNPEGVIRLYFDPEGLRTTGVFMDYCLQSNLKGRKKRKLPFLNL